MKIKKTIKSSGGAAIADRFKIDAAAAAKPQTAGTVNRTAAAVALAFGGIALAMLGLLVYMLWSHWMYMQSA